MKSMTHLAANGLFAIALVAGSLQLQIANADEWTDNTGARTIQADFVKLDGVQLTLRKADGKEVTLPLHKLDDKSRIRARAIARAVAKGEARPGVSSSGSIPSSSGPAGSSSAGPQGGTVIPSDLTAQQFSDFVSKEIEVNKNYSILFDAFPPSYQKDIEDVFKQAVSKVDQSALNEIKKTRNLIVNTLKEKKSFILASQKLPMDPAIKPIVVNAYDPVVAMINEVLPDSLLDHSRLSNTPVRELIGPYAQNLSRNMENLGKYIPMIQESIDRSMKPDKGSKFEQTSENEAMQVTEIPGFPPVRVPWVKMEGRWINKQMQDSWKQGMDQARATLGSPEAASASQMIKKGASATNLTVGILANAETQEDVDDVLGSLLDKAGQLMPMMGGGFGPPGGMGPR